MSITKEQAEQMQQCVNASNLRYKQRSPEKTATVGERPERGNGAEKKRKTVKLPTPGIPTTFIGVDPALRAGGFWVCVICRVENIATFLPCKHLGEFVRIVHDANPIAVLVENSNLQKNMFAKMAHTGVGGALSVGKNMGVSQAATDIASEYSQIPSGISPQEKGAKIVNESVFSSHVRANGLTLSGYKPGESPGQDQRDAFKIACICEQQYRLHLKVKK